MAVDELMESREAIAVGGGIGEKKMKNLQHIVYDWSHRYTIIFLPLDDTVHSTPLALSCILDAIIFSLLLFLYPHSSQGVRNLMPVENHHT